MVYKVSDHFSVAYERLSHRKNRHGKKKGTCIEKIDTVKRKAHDVLHCAINISHGIKRLLQFLPNENDYSTCRSICTVHSMTNYIMVL